MSIFRRRPQGSPPPDDTGRGPFRRRPSTYDTRRGSVPPELDPHRQRGAIGGAPAGGARRGLPSGRLILALVFIAIPVFAFVKNCEENPYTGRNQSVSMTPDQEIQLGLQARPELTAQFGGLHPDPRVRERVARIGARLVERTVAKKSGYPFEFHALADAKTVNAFALPGGQVFITAALLERFDTDGQVAGVLGHEIGHVIGRHGAERVSKMQLVQGITGGVLIATYDPNNASSQQRAAMVALIGNLVNMKWGRDQELESDRLGVTIMLEAGYHPEQMIRVMEVLAEAGGGGRQAEFFSTHPNPENRIERIREAIDDATKKLGGLPADLER